MSLSLVFLIVGAALLAGSSVSFRGSAAISVRTASAAALTAGSLMLLVGLVNVLSGTP